MPSYRSVVDVISQLIPLIPTEEEALILELEKYSNTLWNIAPELLSTRAYWVPLSQILSTHILDIDVEWKREVQVCFNGSP
jgi:hypothetical protein